VVLSLQDGISDKLDEQGVLLTGELGLGALGQFAQVVQGEEPSISLATLVQEQSDIVDKVPEENLEDVVEDLAA